jgi:hypothetical protein
MYYRIYSKDAILNILLRKKDEIKILESSNNYKEHYTLKHWSIKFNSLDKESLKDLVQVILPKQ